jgi:putative membrane protein
MHLPSNAERSCRNVSCGVFSLRQQLRTAADVVRPWLRPLRSTHTTLHHGACVHVPTLSQQHSSRYSDASARCRRLGNSGDMHLHMWPRPLLFVILPAYDIYLQYTVEVESSIAAVIGTLVSLTVGFRCATAHTRFYDGRREWANVAATSQKVAQIIWFHVKERHSEDPVLGKRDLLAKISCLNLISAFAVALKHKLQFEPYLHYDDLEPFIGHLDTLANAADVRESPTRQSMLEKAGHLLGVTMTISEPQTTIKQASGSLGNIPLEIINHISSYTRDAFANGTLNQPAFVTALKQINEMNHGMAHCDRILTTPIPMAYSTAIYHVSWAYLILLPFQFVPSLGWYTIIACLTAAYMILGLVMVGTQTENPFGHDMNCLPLDTICDQIRHDVEVLLAFPQTSFLDLVRRDENKPLFPLSQLSARAWEKKSVDEIRQALAMMPGHRSREKHGEDLFITLAPDSDIV